MPVLGTVRRVLYKIAPVGFSHQRGAGLGSHLEGVIRHILGIGSVEPRCAELRQTDVTGLGRHQFGRVDIEHCISADGHGNIFGIRAGQHDGGSVLATGRGRIGHSDQFALFGIIDSDAGLVQGEHASLVLQRQRHAVKQTQAHHVDACRGALVHIGIHLDLEGRYPDSRGGHGRLDADDHLLLEIERITGIAESVQRKVTIADATPTPVHVIGIVGGIIAIYIEGVARPTLVTLVVKGAIHHGAALDKLGQQHLGPISIADEHRLVAKGVAKRLGHQFGTVIVAEELDGTQDVAALRTAAVGRVVHVLFLTNVAHQPSHSIGLLVGVIALDVLIQHVVPVKSG